MMNHKCPTHLENERADLRNGFFGIFNKEFFRVRNKDETKVEDTP